MSLPRYFLIVAACFATAGCIRNAAYYAEAGNKFFDNKQYDDASLQYRKAIQKDPQFGEAYYRLGLTIVRQEGSPYEAYRILNRAVELMPQNVPATLALADLAVNGYMADPARPAPLHTKATEVINRLLSQDPNLFDALRLKGTLLMLDRNPGEAIKYFERARKQKPADLTVALDLMQALFQTNRSADAERLALGVIAQDRTNHAPYDLLYVQQLRRKRYDEAEKALQLKAENNPKDITPLLDLAKHYQITGKTAKAEASVKRALELPTSQNRRLLVGQYYTKLGKWQEARQQFESGIKSTIGRDQLPFLKGMADVHMALGDQKEAARLIDMVLALDRNHREALSMKAELLLRSGTAQGIGDSSKILTEVAAKNPKDPLVRYLLGRARMANGDLNGAMAEFKEALRIQAKFDSALLAVAEIAVSQSKYQEALEYLGRILEDDPRNITARLLSAEAQIGSGSIVSAQRLLADLGKEAPRNISVQLQLGFLALAQKNFSEAEARIRNVYRPGNSDVRAVVALSEVYTQQKRFDTAIQLLTVELDKLSDSISLRRQLAGVAVRARNFNLAIEQYRRLIALRPESPEFWFRAAQVWQMNGEIDKALSSLEKAGRVAPGDPFIPAYIADTLRGAGRIQEAQRQYQLALKIKPDLPVVLNNLAYLTLETGGNLEEALSMAQRAVQLDGAQPAYLHTLGLLYLKNHKAASAVQTLGSLIKQHPKNSLFRYHMALALIESGNRPQAQVHLREALAQGPSKEDENKILELLAGR